MNFGVEFQKNFYNILEEIHMKIGVMSDTHGSLTYFEKALDVPVKFDIELPYDEQVELSENTGVPIINEYHKVKLFGGNYKKAFMELVDIILTDNEE